MNDIYDPKLTVTLVQVATMYYDQNLSQQQIADGIGVSRSLVASYLKKAREDGIVNIKINNPLDNCEDLALILQAKTNLHYAHVIPASHNSPALTRRSIAGALGRHLDNSLKNGDCLGVGFGRTISELTEVFSPTRSRSIDVMPVIGESTSGLIGTYSQVNQHVLRIAKSLNGTPHFLLGPLIVHSDSLAKNMLEDETFSTVVKYWDSLTHICFGVGTLPPVQGEVVYIGEENLQVFMDAGGVGDICTRYFDRYGNFIDTPFYNRIISIRVDQIRRTEHVIADLARAIITELR